MTDLYREFGILPPLDQEHEKPQRLTLEERLVKELRAADSNLTKLFAIRDEMIKAGRTIDAAFNAVLDGAAKVVVAITDHPLIKAKFTPVEDVDHAGSAEDTEVGAPAGLATV